MRIVIERDEWESADIPYTVWQVTRPDGWSYDVHDALASTRTERAANLIAAALANEPDPIAAVMAGKIDHLA